MDSVAAAANEAIINCNASGAALSGYEFGLK